MFDRSASVLLFASFPSGSLGATGGFWGLLSFYRFLQRHVGLLVTDGFLQVRQGSLSIGLHGRHLWNGGALFHGNHVGPSSV